MQGQLSKQLLGNAIKLRSQLTDAERVLWGRLRGEQLGAKFRRQHPCCGYVLDFVSLKHKLVVEVDGGQHQESPQDRVRDRQLGLAGFRTLRFWNHDVLTQTDVVLQVICEALSVTAVTHPHPNPPLEGEGTQYQPPREGEGTEYQPLLEGEGNQDRSATSGRDGVRQGPRRGFTLIEMLVVLALIGTLMLLVAPRYLSSVDHSKEVVLKENLYLIRDAIDKYHADTGNYPDSLQDLVSKKYLRRLPIDPITESTTTWTFVAPGEGQAGTIYDVRSGAPGAGADGVAYGSW